MPKSFKPHGAFIETLDNMQCMVNELNKLQGLPRDMEDDHEKVQKLCRKYPFLNSTKQEPTLGNAYWELTARLRVWADALAISKHLLVETEEARPDLDAFLEFRRKFSIGQYTFLWEQPLLAPKNQFLLYYYAYDAFWAFIQNMDSERLTPSQKQDKQKLGRWIA